MFMKLKAFIGFLLKEGREYLLEDSLTKVLQNSPHLILRFIIIV
jgi:hypothetical protein